jgi:hypothetical protein
MLLVFYGRLGRMYVKNTRWISAVVLTDSYYSIFNLTLRDLSSADVTKTQGKCGDLRTNIAFNKLYYWPSGTVPTRGNMKIISNIQQTGY